MDPEKDTQIESAQDLEAEKEHLGEVKEDDIREKIVSEFGFDPDTEADKIEKAIQWEKGHRKALSTTISQKIKYRTEYQKLKTNPPSTSPDTTKSVTPEDLDGKVAALFEQRDLESMEYPDDIKATIAQVAKINNTSVKKAESDPYVAAKIESWKKQQDADEAALSRTNRNGGKTADDTIPPDVDLGTPEGRKAHDDWRARMIAKGY